MTAESQGEAYGHKSNLSGYSYKYLCAADHKSILAVAFV